MSYEFDKLEREKDDVGRATRGSGSSRPRRPELRTHRPLHFCFMTVAVRNLSNRLLQHPVGVGLGDETVRILLDQEPLSNQLSRCVSDRFDVPAVVSVPFLE